jgi:hypothetical protein
MFARLTIKALIVLVLVACTGTAHSQTRSKDDAIRELFELTGVEKLMDDMLHNALNLMLTDRWKAVKKAYPNAPNSLMHLMKNAMTQAFEDTKPRFISSSMSVYARYFTVSDLEKIISFYKTPVGKKLIRVTPKLIREVTTAGYYWGRDVAGPMAMKRIRELLQHRGYGL